MPRIKDLAGQRVNMLTVIEPVGCDKHGYLLWRCKCDCGNEKIISSGDFRKGHHQSCGCFRKIWPKTHGKTEIDGATSLSQLTVKQNYASNGVKNMG